LAFRAVLQRAGAGVRRLRDSHMLVGKHHLMYMADAPRNGVVHIGRDSGLFQLAEKVIVLAMPAVLALVGLEPWRAKLAEYIRTDQAKAQPHRSDLLEIAAFGLLARRVDLR
jgi:hypothetical protein